MGVPLENIGLILTSIAVGIVLAVLVIGRRGSNVIEMSRRDKGLQDLYSQRQTRDPPKSDDSR